MEAGAKFSEGGVNWRGGRREIGGEGGKQRSKIEGKRVARSQCGVVDMWFWNTQG